MFIGRVTKTPDEPRQLPNGSSVIKFRLAVGRGKKRPDGTWDNSDTMYIDCEAYSRPDAKRNLVDVVHRFVKQGDQIFIEGRLQLDEWTDKTTGQQRSKHKVVIDSIELLGGNNSDGQQQPRNGAEDLARQHDNNTPEDDGGVPF
jgi:single-strand DNA-binding protein